MAHSEEIHIRKATSSDLLQMFDIMDQSLESPSPENELPERLELWLPRFEKPDQCVFYVAEDTHGNIVGWCRGGRTVEVHRRVAQRTYDHEVNNLHIHPQYQRRGIGRRLWLAVWKELFETFQAQSIVVWSVDKEPAQRFYRSFGGVVADHRKFSEESVHSAFVWDDFPASYRRLQTEMDSGR